MKLIKPSYEILFGIDLSMLKNVERAGRTCYKSEEKQTADSAKEFIKKIIESGHESVIEHQSVSVLFICDRGVSHEIVRHRLCSFSQESTRFCNYNKDQFDNQLTFIIPLWFDGIDEGKYEGTIEVPSESPRQIWLRAMHRAELDYIKLIKIGWQPQQARSVLPNALKTEIVVTANLREWRTIFKQRTSVKAHPQMRELMVPLLEDFKEAIPVVFDDIKPYREPKP